MGEKPPAADRTRSGLRQLVVGCLVAFLVWCALSYYVLAADGRNPMWMYLFHLFFLLLLTSYFFATPCFVLASLLQKKWRKAMFDLCLGIGMFLFAVLAIEVNRYVQRLALQEYVKPLAPVAVAIGKYQQGTGRLPHSLDELLPQYLNATPVLPLTYRQADGSWVLQVPVETVFFSSEYMVRGPQVNKGAIAELFGYGEDPEGLVLAEPLGEWFYVYLSMP